MISKRQKFAALGVFGLLLLLSLAGVVFAFMIHDLTPMVIHDSSPELSSKVSDVERMRILGMVRSALLHLALILSFLAAAWAVFAGCVISLWIRNSKDGQGSTRV